MRKRYIAALAALGLLAVAGGQALAAAPRPADAAAPDSGRPSVTLPTGDKVLVTGDGALMMEPAPGREDIGYYSPDLPGGDRLVIPLDHLDDVRGRTADDRLYNVDALLRNGFTDARQVPSPDVLGDSALSHEPADARATEITVKYSWLDGSVPATAGGAWVNLDTGDIDFIDATDGVATLNLAPGKYGLLADMFKPSDTEPWEVVGTVLDLTVTDTPATVVVDGTASKPVGVTVDHADAALVARELTFFADRSDGTSGPGSIYGLGGADKVYAIPSAEPQGHAAGLSLRSELASPPGVAEPYSYSLFNLADKGIPADPAFTVHDKDLAVRNVTYHSLGAGEASMERRNLSYHGHHVPFGYPPGSQVAVGTTRTEYYTADPEVTWSHLGQFTGASEDAPSDDVLHNSGAMAVGTEDEEWLSAPLSVRVPDPRFPYYGSGVERWPFTTDSLPELLARMPMFSSGADDEVIASWGVPGESVISKDGQELAKQANGSAIVADLPEDDKGRYTVTMDANREVAWTPLGTRSTATWVFDSAPVTEDTVLSVSAVRFDAAGVVDGYAERARPQEVTLDYETQPGAEDRQCQDMTFEVSYDDGATWSTVDITRDGDHASATLNHPDGAEFVSVRFTAVDDTGQTVETSTIRSYRLR